MPQVRAVLLDVFGTVLAVDFDAALDDLAAASGLDREDWVAGLRLHGHDVMTGALTAEETFEATFRLAGKPPGDIKALVRRDLELLQEHATLYPDVLPFLAEIHQRGISLAFVSNCAPNAGALLEELGLAALADVVLLSCDVGSVKPDAGIYCAALDALSVDPADAVFVDDQTAYCSGAEALGMVAVRIDRSGVAPGSARSLGDVLPMFSSSIGMVRGVPPTAAGSRSAPG